MPTFSFKNSNWSAINAFSGEMTRIVDRPSGSPFISQKYRGKAWYMRDFPKPINIYIYI